MKSFFVFFSIFAIASAASANPFAGSDPKIGKKLVDQSCIACHAAKFGGDGSKIYTRPNHKVKTPEQLRAQVSACSTQLDKSWFPEEEAHVAAYLNQSYYHFK